MKKTLSIKSLIREASLNEIKKYILILKLIIFYFLRMNILNYGNL